MTAKVRTLTGDVEPSSLGMTLVHEHLAVDWGEMTGRPKVVDFDYDETVGRIVERLDAAAAVGLGAIGECTPIGAGRYVDLFTDVARRTSVKIVASTGFFHESWCPIHPLAKALDLDAMTDLFVREITEGMGGTLTRAGMIKCATSEDWIRPNEEKVLRAAARAHRATGCPIITHTTEGLGSEQLDLFASEGVAPDEIIISHVGTEKDPEANLDELLRRGAVVSIDEISYPMFEDEHWIGLIDRAVRQGGIRQVLIAHDALVIAHGPEEMFPYDVSDYGYIPRVFVPKLQRATGLSDEHVRVILEENPQRVLAAF